MNNITFKQILDQQASIFKSIKSEDVGALIKLLLNYKMKGRIIGLGAGRMGYSLRAFIMRLGHLGFNAYMIGDTNLPRVGPSDLVLVNSSSGHTPSIVLHTEQAKDAGATVVLLTSAKDSRIAKIADVNIHYTVSSNLQLMKTANEQFSMLFFDYIAQRIAYTSGEDIRRIEHNHSILE
ncbi:SIS domain-containing protein [Rhodobacterales bacterium FZCC0188]|nr:SIS domain-containing protein [Rhodobacterales bacterium FZCC0188]